MKKTDLFATHLVLATLLSGSLASAQQAPAAPAASAAPADPNAGKPAPPLPADAPHAADIAAARQVAEAWIQLLDQGRFDEAYQQMGPTARRQISQQQWREQLKATREKSGKLDSRIFQYPNFTTTLRGAPAGEYVVLNYLCTFASHRSSPETIVMAKGAAGWHVAGFSVA
jgi:hypothetical protein